MREGSSLPMVGASMLSLHEEFAVCIERLLQSLIADNGMKIQSVASRVKEEGSIQRKLLRKKKESREGADMTSLHDLAGVRVLLYFKSDVQEIRDLLRREFHIVQELDVRKYYPHYHQSLGYAARHFVVTLSDHRRQFAEYRRFRALRCEIQVTTVLEHAWAEVEHDLYYKREEEEVAEEHLITLEREFALIAGFIRQSDERINKLGVLSKKQKYRRARGTVLEYFHTLAGSHPLSLTTQR